MELRVPVVIPVSKPRKGAAGETGLWRVEKPLIDEGKCIKCWICWLYCPEEVIFEGRSGFPVVDMSYCKGCGVCADVCPAKAIEMVRE